jgi:hypothetical protein
MVRSELSSAWAVSSHCLFCACAQELVKEFLDPWDADLTNLLLSDFLRQGIVLIILDGRCQYLPSIEISGLDTSCLAPFRPCLASFEPSKRPNPKEVVSFGRNANLNAHSKSSIANRVAPERPHTCHTLAARVNTEQRRKLITFLEQRLHILETVFGLATLQTDAFEALAVLLRKHARDSNDVVEVTGIPVVLKCPQGEIDVRSDERGGLVEKLSTN